MPCLLWASQAPVANANIPVPSSNCLDQVRLPLVLYTSHDGFSTGLHDLVLLLLCDYTTLNPTQFWQSEYCSK